MLSTIIFNFLSVAAGAGTLIKLVLQALLLTVLFFGVFSAVVCCWAVIAQLFVGGALIAAFSAVTMPRRKVCNVAAL